MKIFIVTCYPEDYNPNTNCEITDVTPILNNVKYFAGSMDHFYGEYPSYNPKWYSVQVKSKDKESAKEKGEKLINEYKRTQPK